MGAVRLGASAGRVLVPAAALVVLVALGPLGPSTTRAQERTECVGSGFPAACEDAESDAERHECLFAQAEAAMGREDAALARDILRCAQEIRPDHGPTAYFLAVTLRDTGAPVASAALLDALLAGDYGELPDVFRQQAELLRAEVGEAIAELVIRVVEPEEGVVQVDGVERGRAASDRPLRLNVDPGPHLVRGSAEDHEPDETRVRVARGESREIDLRLAPVEKSFAQKPGFVVLMGVIGAVLIGGVSVGLYLGLRGRELRTQEPYGEVIQTLRVELR